MRNNKRIAVAVAVVMGLVAVWAGWGAVHVGAQAPRGGDRIILQRQAGIEFGMVGIIAGQTARLNVVYQAPDSPDKKRSDPVGIVVQLQFLDADGEVIAGAEETLMPGESAFLDLERRGIVVQQRRGIVVQRQQIRGIVVQQQIRGIVVQQGTLLGTVEVFDNATGQTQFVLPGTTAGIVVQ